MSDPRHSMLLIGLLLLGAGSAGAQSAAEWRAQRDAKSAEAKALSVRYDSLVQRRDSARARLRVAGVQIQLSDTNFTDADTAAFAQGIRQAMTRLTSRYGTGISTFVDARPWNAYISRAGRVLPGTIALMPPGGSGIDRHDWMRPLKADRIADAVERWMSANVAAHVQELRAYPSDALFRGLDRDEWFIASRDLSLSWQSTGRRCAAGTLSACETHLAPFDSVDALERYFDRSDYRMLASTAELPVSADSTTFALRRLCREGVDSACAPVVRKVRITDPIGAAMRGTLAAHAFELAGDSAVARLTTAPRGAALPMLAHIAGTTPAELVRSWRDRMTRGLAEGRVGTPAVALASMFWIGLLVVAVGRRRPA